MIQELVGHGISTILPIIYMKHWLIEGKKKDNGNIWSDTSLAKKGWSDHVPQGPPH